LTGIAIPGSVTSIEGSAFVGCVNLVSILMLDNAPTTSYVDPDDFLGFSVYYDEGNTGFTPHWRGYRTVAVPRFDPAEATLSVLALPPGEGEFSLVVFGRAGRAYQLQRRSDLTDAAPPSDQAFYRAVEVAP
jgi:hypothetical protein